MLVITMEVYNIQLLQPRKRYKWMMTELKSKGHSTEVLRRLNRVRVHQQVLFLSDVLGASVKSLHRKYLKQIGVGGHWSTFLFPKEKPPRKDFRLWKQEIAQLIPAGGIMDRLRNFKAPPQKIWEWRLDNEDTRLLHIKGGVMDLYKLSQVRRYATTPNQRTQVQIAIPKENVGQYCTIREVAPEVIAVVSHMDPPPSPLKHDSFLDVLIEWGCTWMWDSMLLVGKYDWIKKAIAHRSCVAVTDGSYMRKLYPNECSTTLIFECTNTTGRLIGSFPETTVSENSYQGKLLGFMAIHLNL